MAALRSAERNPGGCSDDEYLALATADGPALDAVAALADSLRRDTVGDDVTFVVNRNINFTNICYTGCRFCAFAQRKGDADGGMQPPTLMFSMRGVATQRLRDAIAEHPDIYDMDIMPAESFRNEKFITVGLRNQIAKAREAGIDLPVARTILITGMSEDEIWVNMSRVNGVDPTDPGSYTRGEIEARKQVYQIRKYLRHPD